MTGFDPSWLALREPADHRARNDALAEALSARFALRDTISVVDLGCGTGSNLRALSGLLPKQQHWTLVDYDPNLLEAARQTLSQWADTATRTADGYLDLVHDGRRLHVAFRNADLNADLDRALGSAADLVTAAAFFDLASPAFIRRLAAAVASRKAVFYTVLTYNGIQLWSPRSPADSQMAGAFNRHQMSDKGLGPAAGPTAPAHLADQFRLAGFSVEEADSPWRLRAPGDAALIAELARGYAAAVAETGAVDARTLERWQAMQHTGAETGHTDTLAFPV